MMSPTPASCKSLIVAVPAAPVPPATTIRMSLKIFADDRRGVDQRGKYDDGSAVLIVVHHRDVERLDQPALDFEAARRGDIFEIDAAENRGDANDGLDDLVDVFRIETHRPRVDLPRTF